MPSEEQILQQAGRFERKTLTWIYDQYSPGLYSYALRLLGDAQLAEDCVSETFTRFLRVLKKGRGPSDHLQAYLYRIAHNWIVDHYRRPGEHEDLDADIPDQEHDLEQIAAARMDRQRIRSALQLLTSDQQQVIALKYLQGWDNASIARVVGKPVSAVKSLQHRALKRLERLLRKEDE